MAHSSEEVARWLVATCDPRWRGEGSLPPGPVPPGLAAAAGTQGVAALVAARLAGRRELPGELRDLPGRSRARAEAQEVILLSAAERLERAGIPFLVLKGLPLDRRLGWKRGDRWHKDIDLLVARRDVPPAREVLSGLGYRPVPVTGGAGFHEVLVRPGWQATGTLELHWDVTPDGHPVRFPVDSWLAAPGRVTLSGTALPVPPAPGEVGYLAWHAFARGVALLRDLAVVAAAWCRLPGEARHRALEEADRAGAARFLGEALRLAGGTWPGIPGPGPSPRPGGVRGRCLAAFSRAGRGLAGGSLPPWQEQLLVHWALLPGSGFPAGLPGLVARAVPGTGGGGAGRALGRWGARVKGGVSVLLVLLRALVSRSAA